MRLVFGGRKDLTRALLSDTPLRVVCAYTFETRINGSCSYALIPELENYRSQVIKSEPKVIKSGPQ
jgi:hypothetical protein